MALKAVGLASTHDSQQAQHPRLSEVPKSVSVEIPEPGTITAAARVEGLPLQLPWAQVLPHSTCQPPSPWAVLGRAVPASTLEEAASRRGAVSAAGSWRRKPDPGANGLQSPA